MTRGRCDSGAEVSEFPRNNCDSRVVLVLTSSVEQTCIASLSVHEGLIIYAPF